MRDDVGAVEDDLVVEHGVVVGHQRPPVGNGGVPVVPVRGVGTAFEVGEGGVVGGDQAGLGARLDRHVAHRHPPLHREAADHLAPVLDDRSDAAAGAEAADDRQDHVLGRRALGQRAVHRDGERARPLLEKRLGRQHVLDLAGADAERQGAERPVCAGVAVAAHHGHAGQGEAHLGADHVHDALARVAHRIEADPELVAVVAQRLDLLPADRVGDGLVDVGRGDVVVLGGDRQVRAAQWATGHAEAVEGLRRGHLVDQVQVDEQEVGLTVGSMHDVAFPHLLAERLSGHARFSSDRVDPQATGRRRRFSNLLWPPNGAKIREQKETAVRATDQAPSTP